MPRISFSTDNVGAVIDYELSYNPIEIDAPTARPSDVAKSVETVDGEAITFNPYFDSRRGSMRWKGYRSDTSVTGLAFEAQIVALRLYVGTTIYMSFMDIADAFGVYPSDQWQKIKVIAVNVSLRSGSSTIYDPVEFVWEDVEE